MMYRLSGRPSPATTTGTTPMGIHVPGLLRWAKAGFMGNGDDPMIAILGESFGIKREVAVAILSGEVDLISEGDDVLFDWPDDKPYPEESKHG